MYITLNSWLGGQKMAKRKYLRRHRKKRGPSSGKKSSFFNLDLIKSNGRVLVAFLMFGAESRICSFEKEILFFFRFFFYYDFDCGLFSLFFLRSLTIITRSKTNHCWCLCCTFNNVCQVQFFLFVYKKAIVQPSTTLWPLFFG